MNKKRPKSEVDAQVDDSEIIEAQAKQISILPWLAVAWLVVYFVLFFSFTLPNNPSVSRTDLIRLLPELLMQNIAPIKEEGAAPSGVQFLPQRFSFLAVLAFVLAGAWGLGHQVLRWLRVKYDAEAITTELERSVFAFGIGLSGFSLMTLGLGLLGIFSQFLFILIPIVFIMLEAVFRIRTKSSNLESRKFSFSGQIETPKLIAIGIIVPFLVAMLLGSMLPSIDFDVREYHIQGPKEYLQNGQITMLPHNMYTSFPFLTEMLTLMAMVVYGDWYWGALAGKAVLMSFAPLTALTLFVMVRRYFNSTAACLSAILYLTTPWAYRISIIAYTEGALSFFVAISLFALMLGVEKYQKSEASGKWFFITGLLAGSAVATKYPGLISVGIPLCGFACFVPFIFRIKDEDARTPAFSQALKITAICSIGVLITFGPWLAKNLYETGNSVYPLMYSVFGGADWDPVLNDKFKAGHRPDNHHLSALATSFVDVTFKNDWLSPLLFSLAPFSILALNRKRIGLVAAYLGWLFITWWVLTHRIDRFWVPLIPVVAFLGGVGLDAVWRWFGKFHLGAICKYSFAGLIGFAILFNLGFITTALCGYNAYLIDLNESRERMATKTVHFLKPYMKDKQEAKALFVGEAQVFDATYPVIYNTVFDYSLFENWCGIPDENLPADEWEMKAPNEIRMTFKENNIAVILVNWQEVLRYRLTYGYTKFVTPKRFEWLQENGIIGEPIKPNPFYRLWKDLNSTEQKEIEKWAPELIVTIQGEKYFHTTQYFSVILSKDAK